MFIVAWRYDDGIHCPDCYRKRFYMSYIPETGDYGGGYTDKNVLAVFAYDYLKPSAVCATCGHAVGLRGKR